MNLRTILFVLIPAFLGTQALFSQSPAPLPTPGAPDYSVAIQNLQNFIPDEMGRNHMKSLSIALVDGDRVVWVKGFGYADGDRKIQASCDTLYHIGALSKIFTAAEVLKLAEEGKVGLDKPLSQYLPGFSVHSRFKKTKPMTVRSLLANHSGLPGFFIKGVWVDHPQSLSDLVDELKSEYRVSPPQTLYKASYVDYDLLGRMVELKRKKAFADALKEDLFDPWGMDSSSFDNSSDGDPRLAQGFQRGDNMPPIHLRDIPAAGMVSSANDMARFLQFLLGGKAPGDSAPLKPATLKSMFETQYPDRPLDFGHQTGLGWQLSGLDIEGSQGTAWRDGVYPPYVAGIDVLYRQGLGVVFLSNSGEGDLQQELAVRALKLMLEAKFGIKADLNKKKIEMPKTIELAPGQLDRYSGFYSALGQLMKVFRQDNHLSANFQGHQLDLLPVTPDTFVPHLTFLLLFPVDLPQYPLTFSTVEGGDVALLGGLPFPIPLEKIEPVDIPQAWKDREGEYEIENPDGQFQFNGLRLEEREGFLTVESTISSKLFDVKDQEFKVALLPLSDEDAVVPGLFYWDGETLHAQEDNPTRIFYSGYWFRKKAVSQTAPAVTPTPLPTP
jgi:CubicO group peptidase (beta-lactamase class C family)